MIGVLTHTLLPWKWPAIPFKVGRWLVKKAVATYKALPRPKSLLGRFIVEPLYIWIAIPGSVPYSLMKIGEFLGYGPAMLETWNALKDFGWGTGVVVVDLLLKIGAIALAAAGKALLPLLL